VLRALLAAIEDDLRGRRDRALLLVGFAGALRRSELAAIHLADIERTDQGFRLTLARSKGSQAAAAGGIAEGSVFCRIWSPPAAPDGPPALPALGTEALTPRSIARIIQARAAAAGFAPREFAGHSLKRGALTTGMERGAHAAQLRRLGRHKTFDVLGEYLEFGNLFDQHQLSDVL
jgi:site-specific recombinase XerD